MYEFHSIIFQDTDQTPFTSASLCNGFTPLTAFMTETEFLSQRVNNLINSVDPTFHEGLERLRNAIKHIPNVRAFADIDPILMEGRYLNFNQSTSLHATPGDFEAGWNVLISLGSFTEGGYVRIPRLGLRGAFLTGGCPCSARGVPRARSGGLVGRTEDLFGALHSG